ncbi:unnamed protein product [Toxocara canis]|uniref:G_PROTEIN_RECEP_F1_2 domain-containing protein n=1 Tax=Toxocara canis TaxID=6265 RepID=A0A183UZM2_TOXCA|nr:unnamed protein product [Toxocara canis]
MCGLKCDSVVNGAPLRASIMQMSLISDTFDYRCYANMGMIGKLLTINTHLTTVLCIAPNSLVICLILTTSHEEIREYRLILAVQSVLEVLTCTMLSLLDLVRLAILNFLWSQK